MWALSYYLTQSSSGCQAVASRRPDSQRPDVVGKATPNRGGPRKPLMELTPTSGEQERHNVTVITVGSKYEVYVRSPAPSHMQTLEQPFRTLAIKWEVNIFLKKSSCVLSSCVVYYCVCYHCVGMYPVYICMQHYKIHFIFLLSRTMCLL